MAASVLVDADRIWEPEPAIVMMEATRFISHWILYLLVAQFSFDLVKDFPTRPMMKLRRTILIKKSLERLMSQFKPIITAEKMMLDLFSLLESPSFLQMLVFGSSPALIA